MNVLVQRSRAVPVVPASVGRRNSVWRPWLVGASGVVISVLAWQWIANLPFVSPHVLPSPLAIVVALFDVRGIIASELPVTLGTAALGYLLGNAIAIVSALVAGMWSPAERVISGLAVTSHALPMIALAPVLVAVSPGSGSGIALAALSVVFTTIVGTLTGMRWPDPRLVEAVRVFGGGATAEAVRVRLPSAMSGMFSGLLLGVPAALVGALMAEYMLAGRGMGAAIIAAQEGLNVPRVWALCLCIAVVSGILFMLVQLAQRIVIPWATEIPVAYRSASTKRRGVIRSIGDIAGGTIGFAVIACGLWWLLLVAFRVTPYLGKTPWDVAGYLIWAPEAADHNIEILAALGPTVGTAGLGLVAGTVVALVLVGLFAMLPAVRRAAMPTILIARSVPLLAMIPLVTVAFGNTMTTIIIFTAMLSFFPTLITVLLALDSIPAELTNLARAYHGARWQTLRYVQLPAIIPAVLQSLRITATGAVLGAVVTEWLAMTTGIGHLMLTTASEARYTALWSIVVVVTLVSLVIYAVVVLLESAVRKRLT